MHDKTERRLSFGQRADLYDEVRPRYADALFDEITRYARIDAESRILDIGCGTGIATRPFAALGCAALGLEVSEAMAAVARRNFAHLDNVAIRTAPFEAWKVETDAFDLVTCAQAWHWLDPAIRCERVAEALRPAGAIALFGHGAATDFAEGQAAYRRYAPEWFVDPKPLQSAGEPALESRVAEYRRPLAESGLFHDIESHRWPWTRTYDAESYIRLISTYSDHATLPEPRRSLLYEALARAIEDAGGRIERPYWTVLVLARA